MGKETLVWFVTLKEVIKLRMLDENMSGMVAAAKQLHARFFVTHHHRFVVDAAGPRMVGHLWKVYDTQIPQNFPTKTFISETLDAPVMWALAKGAGG